METLDEWGGTPSPGWGENRKINYEEEKVRINNFNFYSVEEVSSTDCYCLCKIINDEIIIEEARKWQKKNIFRVDFHAHIIPGEFP